MAKKAKSQNVLVIKQSSGSEATASEWFSMVNGIVNYGVQKLAQATYLENQFAIVRAFKVEVDGDKINGVKTLSNPTLEVTIGSDPDPSELISAIANPELVFDAASLIAFFGSDNPNNQQIADVASGAENYGEAGVVETLAIAYFEALNAGGEVTLTVADEISIVGAKESADAFTGGDKSLMKTIMQGYRDKHNIV